MFYTLQSIQPQLLSIAKGTAQLGINQENFYKVKIHIPSLERQKEIVEYCEFNDALIQLLGKEIEQNKKQASVFISGIVKTAGGHVENELVETTPIVEEVPNVEEEEAVVLVEEAPKPKKLVKKIKLKMISSEELTL